MLCVFIVSLKDQLLELNMYKVYRFVLSLRIISIFLRTFS